MQERMDKRHITEEIWIALQQDTISPEDFAGVLEHTASCTFCAERLAEVMEHGSTETKAPAYLTGQILLRIHQPDVRASVALKKTSRQVQLLLYSLKVGAAVAFSLLMLFVTTNFQSIGLSQPEMERNQVQQAAEEQGEEKRTLLDIFNAASYGAAEKMNQFTNQILNGGKKE